MWDLHNIDVPIGPQHPALKEPMSLIANLRGERINAVKLRIGYNHRGIEKACEDRTYLQDMYLIERICGICSHSHSTCFIMTVEEIAKLEVPKRATYIRTIVAELERIHSHLLWLGVAGHEIGFDTLLMYTWRDRELVMDLLAKTTGNRVNYGINTIGGVRRDLTPELVKDLLAGMDLLEERTKYYAKIGTEEITLIKRLEGVGVLSPENTITLGAVGPTARASGLARDVRKDDPYLAYGDVEFKVITDNHNDVYGRTLVRIGELLESYSIIRQLIDKLPEGPVSVRAPRRIPAGEAFGRYEAPRGEDVHYIKSNGSDKPDRVKVRAPTLANLQAMSTMMHEQYLADIPIIIAAIDPCFSCTDRGIRLVDGPADAPELMSAEDLRLYGIDWYRKRGIDVSRIKTHRVG